MNPVRSRWKRRIRSLKPRLKYESEDPRLSRLCTWSYEVEYFHKETKLCNWYMCGCSKTTKTWRSTFVKMSLHARGRDTGSGRALGLLYLSCRLPLVRVELVLLIDASTTRCGRSLFCLGSAMHARGSKRNINPFHYQRCGSCHVCNV